MKAVICTFNFFTFVLAILKKLKFFQHGRVITATTTCLTVPCVGTKSYYIVSMVPMMIIRVMMLGIHCVIILSSG